MIKWSDQEAQEEVRSRSLALFEEIEEESSSSSSDGEDCMLHRVKVRTNMFEKARSSINFPLLSWEECGGNNQSFQVEIHIITAD